VIGNRNLADDVRQLGNLLGVERGRNLHLNICCRALDDFQLFLGRGIIDPDMEHEPVELCLRQRVGAFLLDRVLRGEDEERRRQLQR
jgi:hypothetical protein